MAAKKTAKIIVISDDFQAEQVADSAVASMVKGANLNDAVSILSSNIEPDEKDIFMSNEMNFVSAQLTDREAREIAGQPGVEAVEDDVPVQAYTDPGLDEGDLGEGPLDSDQIAAEDIAAAQSHIEEMEAMSDEDAIASAKAELTRPVDMVDDIEFGEMGEVLSLDNPDPGLIAAGEAAGVSRDNLARLIKCVINCALKEMGGNADVSDAQVAQLLSAQGVASGTTAAATIRDYITYGLRLIYAQPAWRFNKGGGVRVAVVDTGIAPRHPDLAIHGGASFIPGVTSWADDNGHGTHVAGTIAARENGRGVIGVAPQARLYAVKVLSRTGGGSTSGVLSGLAWCYRHNMHIVNLSLGSGGPDHKPKNYSRAYEQAGRRLRSKGILAVAAAGNDGHTSRPFVGNPARCPSFMSVASVDSQRRRSSFSNFGPQNEIAALEPAFGRLGRKPGTSRSAVHRWRHPMSLVLPRWSNGAIPAGMVIGFACTCGARLAIWERPDAIGTMAMAW